MYSPRISSINRIRKTAGSLTREEVAQDPSSSSLSNRKSLSDNTTAASSSVASSMMSGDYQVLRTGVDADRSEVMDARLSLASSLDRLGEHHVRQKEYDDAMDAFTEALHEKRSILSILFPSWCSLPPAPGENEYVLEEFSEQRDQAIDDIIHTLRNMGNVHSLRGEQDEAMRYYTEVTNLRATKTSNRVPEQGEDSSTLFSSLGNGTETEDTSTLMSEINEDMKALDDMFRTISFRAQHDSTEMWPNSTKSTPLGSAAENSTSPRNKRSKGDGVQGGFTTMESEPFRRSTSLGFPTSGNDLSEALELYRSVLQNHRGPSLEQHKERLNSLALRVDLLIGGAKESGSRGSHADNLELAVEIHQQVLSAQQEMKAAEEAGKVLPEVSASIASTLIRMGSLYYKLGNRFEELRMYEEAKTIYTNTFGENHAFVAGARKNIGMVLAEKGEYGKAVEQFDKAKRIYLLVRGGDAMNRDVASAISCMGNVKNRLGELDEALEHYMEALEIYKAIQEKVTSPEGKAVAIRDVTATLKVIGMVRAKMGDLDAAMGFFTEAMTLLRSPCVKSSPIGREITASVLARMGSIFVKKGDLDQAMDHYREAYELTVSNRGTANHQEVASILHYIGGIFHKMADYDEAMNCYQEAIRIYHTTLGPGNPTAAGTLVMVGSIHYKRRNLDSAMMFYREALRLNRDAYGLHHPDVAPILKSIGTILTKKGEYKEAYDIFRDVLAIKCTIHGAGHPEVASAYKSLGNVHYKMGELADAERQYRHALTIYRRTRGEEHRDTVAAQTTIEHIRYWMRERGQKRMEERHSPPSRRVRSDEDERA